MFLYRSFRCRTSFYLAGRLSVVLLFSLALGCSVHGGPSLTDSSARYNPVRIAKNISAVPGKLSWSPDGKRFAFINETLTIIDIDSLERKQVAVPHPVSLAWSEDDKLYVLSREQDATGWFVIDTGKLNAVKLPLDREADLLYTLDPDTLIIAAARTNSTRIGTKLSWRLSRYDVASGATGTLSSFSKIYPWKNPDKELLFAWLHAGINPLDRSILVVEHLRPPVVHPYSTVSRIDTLTGEEAGILGNDRGGLYASASWSPDGGRIALADMNGGLMLVIPGNERSGSARLAAPAGVYPSWNPQGSTIYFGGSLIRTDQAEAEPLLLNASRSIGVWSPDGTRLAVAAGGELLLFRNFTPSFSGSDRPLDRALAEKLALLRNLFAEELISRQEYDERKAGLLLTREDRP